MQGALLVAGTSSDAGKSFVVTRERHVDAMADLVERHLDMGAVV